MPAGDAPGAAPGAIPDAAPLPEAVRELLVRRIDSVAELEALLLLVNEPQQRWDAQAVARRLYIGEAAAANVLRNLHQHGLAARRDEAWRFEPDSAGTRDAVQMLSTLYTQRLLTITTLIHGKTARSIDAFAQAFVLRRKE